ncbi:MAG: tRNA (adenosine(37)-N6)-threonylcarbamoyltransferase complex dimerization subunit type 1 TsaB [Bacteroidetes bacterium]|nr:tRNA (adenosine(37)-N6)-threonylcarbamoyltransferase complex dimerization subunit type 1 TsaB [Bacteroidota bacterium]
MALILSIETATEICSAALLLDGNILSVRESNGSNEHSSLLTIYIDEVFKEAGYRMDQMDAVAVSMGPGSYTGLRIGISVAKGLCYSLEKHLIAVSTLKAMAFSAMNQHHELLTCESLLCPMIDARRMEVFMALYDEQLIEVSPVEAVILTEETFLPYESKSILIFGNGAEKCQHLYNSNPNIKFPDRIHATAVSVGLLAEEKFKNAEFENTAYFEPFYLKDFIAGKPRVKGLRE